MELDNGDFQKDCNNALKFIIMFIVLIAGAYIFIFDSDSKEERFQEETSTQTSTRPRAGIPYAFAKTIVKERLVSPKTAEFMPISQAHCVQLPDQKTWKITSFVDSQNKFGATVRTKWYVKIMDTGDSWKLLDIKFGNDI